MSHDTTNPTPASPASDPVPHPTDRRALLAGIAGIGAGALLAGARTAHAGPLNPPAGPVASTGKTLTEVEPRIAINSTNTPGSSATSSIFRITQPGSYYLTGNIIATQINRRIIAIAASGVTIDLNGFLIRGLGTLQGAFDCIFGEPGIERVTVRNGHVELAGRDGINFQDGRSVVMENISVHNCLRVGIVSGTDSIISHCSAVSNETGIFANPNTSVSSCTATSNSGSGISAESGCIITNSTASNNTRRGIITGSSCIISDCSVVFNDQNGIETGTGCTISNCTVNNNGISGIDGGIANTVVACIASENASHGIRVGNGTTVVDCSVRFNGEYGIQCNGNSTIRGNTCWDNGSGFSGGGGILATFSGDNRIEENNCSQSFRGIEATSTGNIILRNTCSGNTTNYVIAANNRYGPIINITASGTAAVNGNSASDTSGTTHPWANFAY